VTTFLISTTFSLSLVQANLNSLSLSGATNPYLHIMSGLEVAGVLLGTFPLIISGLEHWRDVAKVGGFFWRVRKEYMKCRSDVQFHEIVYKRNLKELLLPILNDSDEVKRLVGDPGGRDWTNGTLQKQLEARLDESYGIYMGIIQEMNETAEELRKELSFDKVSVQSKLAAPDPKKGNRSQSPRPPAKVSRMVAVKSKLDYESFRVKFSFNEPVRKELFGRLKECNERLEKLLSSSDKVSALQNASPIVTKQTSALEAAFKKACRRSDLLFRAIQKAWQCPCQQYHFANLRLEHRTLPEICFEVILMFVSPSIHDQTPWSWRELQCGHMLGCSFPSKSIKPAAALPLSLPKSASMNQSVLATPERTRKVAFNTPATDVPKIELDFMMGRSVKLCDLLGDEECGKCMGIIGHDDETYHLHPFTRRKRTFTEGSLTLNQVLSTEFRGFLTRRQRYSIALLLASSVAQLRFTPWLQTGLTKDDVLFFPAENDNANIPHGEPFIRQGFALDHTCESYNDANECNFYSLGILLLELCFGMRLEDHRCRKKYPAEGEHKQTFDNMAALEWSNHAQEEGGEDYASAVRWCFTPTSITKQSWRGEIIKNVIQPLETCQRHFEAAAAV
jgi:hypothetical protein